MKRPSNVKGLFSQPKETWASMDRSDKQMFTGMVMSALATILVWWYFAGRKKYNVKGMT